MRVLDEVLDVFDGNHQRLADAAGVTRQALYRWFMPDMGYVPNRDRALRLSEVLMRMGHPVSAARLMALDESDDRVRNGDASRKGHRRARASQKEACADALAVVKPVDRRESAIGEMAAVQGRGELRVSMVESPLYVGEGLAAA